MRISYLWCIRQLTAWFQIHFVFRISQHCFVTIRVGGVTIPAFIQGWGGKLRPVAWICPLSELQSYDPNWNLLTPSSLFFTFWNTQKCSLNFDPAWGKFFFSSSSCSSGLELLLTSNKTVVKGRGVIRPPPAGGGFRQGVHLPTCTFLFAQRGSYHRVIFVPVPVSVFLCIQRKLFEICKVPQSVSLFHHWHLFWPVDIPVP